MIQTNGSIDIINIFTNLKKRLDELQLSRELIKMNLYDIKNKTDKGILGQTYVIDLTGKNDKINVDYNILIKLLDSIISIHLSLSEKYKNIAQTISDQVSYNDELSELLTESENINTIINNEEEN